MSLLETEDRVKTKNVAKGECIFSNLHRARLVQMTPLGLKALVYGVAIGMGAPVFGVQPRTLTRAPSQTESSAHDQSRRDRIEDEGTQSSFRELRDLSKKAR